jgi:hypothetical protein
MRKYDEKMPRIGWLFIERGNEGECVSKGVGDGDDGFEMKAREAGEAG